MAIEIVEVAAAKGSKGGKAKGKGKPAAKANPQGFIAVAGKGAGNGHRYRIHHPKVNDGKPISVCRFLRLLGFAGFSTDMAYAMLEDMGLANFNPHTMNCQLGSGRQHNQYPGIDPHADQFHHGGANREDCEAFGKLIATARDYYLDRDANGNAIDPAKLPAKLPTKKVKAK